MKDDPKIGDIIGCSDGDIGIVVSTYDDPGYFEEDRLMVEVIWNDAGRAVDVWSSKDFSTLNPMLYIMSRA